MFLNGCRKNIEGMLLFDHEITRIFMYSLIRIKDVYLRTILSCYSFRINYKLRDILEQFYYIWEFGYLLLVKVE